MQNIEKRNLVAQWAFDTRPVLLRFHLWLEDVEVHRSQAEPVSAHTFTPRGIARCLAMTSAATALGTRLFGDFGGGAGKDKQAYNQVKKAADAISAYVMSEGLWHLTRTLPENHAIMVSLGEGLMPKAGETPEMGANPLLGFGRVYARPEVARTVDRRVRRLLNEPGHTFEQFYGWLKDRGITIWGAAVDTLENTSRFAEGKPTGPMAVFHLFDSPLTVTRPYESYMGCLTVPRRSSDAANANALLVDYRTPREKVMEAIEPAYPGVEREERPRLDAAREEPRRAARQALGGVDGARRAPRGGRLEGALRHRGLHRLRHLRADLPRRQLEGRRRDDPRLPLRRLRRDRRGDAGGEPLRGARGRRDDGDLLAELRAALPRGGDARCSSTPTRPTSRSGSRRSSAEGARRGRRCRATRRRSARRPRPTCRSASRCSAPTTSCRRRAGACSPPSATSATTRTPARPASSSSATGSTR